MRPVALVFVLALIGGGCSIDDGSGDSRATTTETSTSTSTAAPTDSTTTVPPSVGIVEVAGAVYEITADCYAPGAGELVATGIALPSPTTRVEVYVQAFVGQPYVGITVIEAETITRYEPAVDRPLDVTHLDDIVRADDISLVTDLDLTTGTGVDAGVGSIVIECRSYAEELPPGFVAG